MSPDDPWNLIRLVPAEGAIQMTMGKASTEASTSSIAPVPIERRTLSPFDVGILWNGLSLGLLVL